MGRQVSARLRLNGTLVATSVLHVGTGTEENGVDLGLARNGAGECRSRRTLVHAPERQRPALTAAH